MANSPNPDPARGNSPPTGWATTTLAEVARFINGRAYKQTELLDSGKYRVLRVGNLFTTKRWYWSDLELEPDKYCDHGDLIYAWSGSFGPRIWKGEKVIFHYHIWKVENDSSKVKRTWLLHWLNFDVLALKASVGTGTTMMHVTKREMERRTLDVPSIDEQEKMVRILDAQLSRLDDVLRVADRVEVECGRLRRSLLQAAFSGELTREWRGSHV